MRPISVKKNILLILLISNTFFSANIMAQESSFSDSLYSLKIQSIEGREVDFEQYRNKILLIVNTASKCGFTGQYQDLEELYQKYKESGVLVLGFPSNDFADQEPEGDEEIKKFCKLRYGVSFPLFKKSSVKGAEKNPLYKLLTEQGPEEMRGDVGWNFVKFIINKEGQLVGRYSSMKNPKKLHAVIEELIDAQAH